MISVVGWGLGLYALLLVVFWLGHRSVLFPAPSGSITPELEGATLERIAASAGRSVYALHVPAPAQANTIVHFHGNGEDLADQIWLARENRKRGLGFFAIEYPGYGLAKRDRPSEAQIYEDAETALARLRDLGVSPERTVLQGMSLGSGVAAEMALRGHGSRLVLIAPYTSIVDLARRLLPIVPVGWIIRDRFETAQKASRLALPALIVHGVEDEVIPADMGRQLSTLLPNARLLLVPSGRHNDLFALHGELVLGEIVRFSRDRDPRARAPADSDR